jgi:hypothetical protein
MGKLLTSHRYNRLSLLPSGPGEVHRSWSYETYPGQRYKKVQSVAPNRDSLHIEFRPCLKTLILGLEFVRQVTSKKLPGKE